MLNQLVRTENHLGAPLMSFNNVRLGQSCVETIMWDSLGESQILFHVVFFFSSFENLAFDCMQDKLN